jgi:hypothetical protein
VVAAQGGGLSSRRQRRPKLKQVDRGSQKRHRLKAVAALARGGGRPEVVVVAQGDDSWWWHRPELEESRRRGGWARDAALGRKSGSC